MRTCCTHLDPSLHTPGLAISFLCVSFQLVLWPYWLLRSSWRPHKEQGQAKCRGHGFMGFSLDNLSISESIQGILTALWAAFGVPQIQPFVWILSGIDNAWGPCWWRTATLWEVFLDPCLKDKYFKKMVISPFSFRNLCRKMSLPQKV